MGFLAVILALALGFVGGITLGLIGVIQAL